MASQNQLTPHGKLAVGVFLIIGLTTFVFGVIRLQRSAAAPFDKKFTGNFKTSEELEQERIEKLKTDDTDQDTLTDYDELYVFRTSPFLEDTDSDGYNDDVELNSNNDPNCPKGKTCREQKLATTGASSVPRLPGSTMLESGSSAQEAQPPAPPNEAVIVQVFTETFGDLKTLTPEMIRDTLNNMSSTELRSFLVRLSLPKETLDQTDDNTLRELLTESLNQAVAAANQSNDQPATER